MNCRPAHPGQVSIAPTYTGRICGSTSESHKSREVCSKSGRKIALNFFYAKEAVLTSHTDCCVSHYLQQQKSTLLRHLQESHSVSRGNTRKLKHHNDYRCLDPCRYNFPVRIFFTFSPCDWKEFALPHSFGRLPPSALFPLLRESPKGGVSRHATREPSFMDLGYEN